MTATNTSECTGADDLCGAPAGKPCEVGCPSLAADAEPSRDYAAEYLAARRAYRAPDATLAEQGNASLLSDEILDAADDAGVRIDCIALDEQARVELYG